MNYSKEMLEKMAQATKEDFLARDVPFTYKAAKTPEGDVMMPTPIRPRFEIGGVTIEYNIESNPFISEFKVVAFSPEARKIAAAALKKVGVTGKWK